MSLRRRHIKSVAIFAGSNDGKDPRHLAEATNLARMLVQASFDIVIGGHNSGVMKAVVESATAYNTNGAKISVIVPEFYHDRESEIDGIEYVIVADEDARKPEMSHRAQASIALSGGIGTLAEIAVALERNATNANVAPDKPVHPIMTMAPNGFWSGPLTTAMLNQMTEGFAASGPWSVLTHHETAYEIMAKLNDLDFMGPIPAGNLKRQTATPQTRNDATIRPRVFGS